jgi:hypothetical protein
MGEKTTVDLSTTAVRQLTKIVQDGAAQVAAAVTRVTIATTAAAAEPCAQLHGEPWMRYDGDDLVAFADDRLVLRWINAGQASEVPAGWRPVLLGEPVKR